MILSDHVHGTPSNLQMGQALEWLKLVLDNDTWHLIEEKDQEHWI